MKSADYTTLPKSRKEAQARNIDRYFTGNPCRHGHVAPRYTRGTSCVVCQLEHARRVGGWRARPSSETVLEKVRKNIERRGGVLLSTEYVSAKTKVRVRCTHNHEFEISPDNLKRGRWCRECKKQNHLKQITANLRSVEELREFARKRHDGDCLATNPTSMLSKLMWKCSKPEHRPFGAVIAKVLHSGQWCPACWQERRKPPKPAIPQKVIEDYVQQRGGQIVRIGKSGAWSGSKTRVVVRCANGHEWPAEASNLLYNGSWCPECFNKGERIVRAIFEATFGGKFPKSKPEWLVSKRRRKLELDGYDQRQQIAFEYQGPHHRLVDEVMAHDAIKREVCAIKGVRLIEIEAVKKPHPPENVLQKVAKAFRRYGITEAPRLPSGEIFIGELNELRELARKKGGRLISERYLGGEAHEWQCGAPEHQSWWAEPWRIRKGKWCPSCAGNRKLGVAGLRSWGATIGLELLDTEYRGGTLALYRWRCHEKGHVVRRTRTNILQSVKRGAGPCPVCAGTRAK